MKLHKIISLFLCVLLVLPTAFTVSCVASAATLEAETVFDFEAFDFSDPSLRIDNFPKDAEFFGVWDSKNAIWTTEPKFNYNHVSQYGGYDLKAVETCVKNGDYEGAKTSLLTYYRQMNQQRGMEELIPTTSHKNLSSLLLYNMHDMVNTSYYLADIFSVGTTWETVSVDMLATVKRYIKLSGITKLPVGLYALTKEGYEAVFYSDESANAPYLELVVNGVTQTVPATHATYIAAGDYVNNNYNADVYLRSCESETTISARDPVDSGTKRAFLMFDLSKYTNANAVTSAKLKLKGRCEDLHAPSRGDSTHRQKIAAIADLNTNWTESTLTWETNATTIFSYAGEQGTNWIQPTPVTNADQVYEEHLLRFSWVPALAATYTDSLDETYARAMFLYLHDFIEDTYNVYRGMPGGWEYPAAHNSVEESKALLYGGYSKSLDLSVRASNLSRYLPYFFDSEYMTPDLFTVFTKYMWAMGDLLSRFWGRSEKAGNWGNYSNEGFFTLMSYYPEFASACDCSLEEGVNTPWYSVLYERIGTHLQSILLEDGSTEEGSTSYTWSSLNNLYEMKSLADTLGVELEYPDSMQENLTKLTKYSMNLLLPWGGDPGFGDCVPHTSSYLSNLYNMGKWLNNPEFLYVASGGEEGTKPDYTSAYYDFRKFMMMRSDWEEDALYLYTSVSSSPYSHNHWDDLNVIVAAYGDYLLIDPGYYTLENNDLNGRNLKSSLSHNTISINGYSTKKYTAPHLTGDAALPNDGTKGNFEYVEFNDHYDFVREVTENNKNIQYLSDPKSTDPNSEAPPFEPGMDSARNILFLRPDFWIVSDYMKPVDPDGPNGDGNTYSQFWHTLPGTNLSIDGQYVLKEGETVGDINEGEFTSQIENTHFVPGTGDGTLRTNVTSGANIMVVPADVKESEADSGVTPKLLRGLYSPMKGSVTTTPYGAFERTETGTTVFDTVLFPTKKGEQYDINTTPQSIIRIADDSALPQGAGSSFRADVKNISGNNSDDYYFNYYILHEVDKQTDVVFGNYSTDGMLAYYEEEQDGTPRNAILKNATYLGDEINDYEIVYAKEVVEDLSVKWENGKILFSTSDEVDLETLTVHSATKPSAVLLNGETVPFTYAGSYVYFGEEPILEIPSLAKYGCSYDTMLARKTGGTGTVANPANDSTAGDSVTGKSNTFSGLEQPRYFYYLYNYDETSGKYIRDDKNISVVRKAPYIAFDLYYNRTFVNFYNKTYQFSTTGHEGKYFFASKQGTPTFIVNQKSGATIPSAATKTYEFDIKYGENTEIPASVFKIYTASNKAYNILGIDTEGYVTSGALAYNNTRIAKLERGKEYTFSVVMELAENENVVGTYDLTKKIYLRDNSSENPEFQLCFWSGVQQGISPDLSFIRCELEFVPFTVEEITDTTLWENLTSHNTDTNYYASAPSTSGAVVAPSQADIKYCYQLKNVDFYLDNFTVYAGNHNSQKTISITDGENLQLFASASVNSKTIPETQEIIVSAEASEAATVTGGTIVVATYNANGILQNIVTKKLQVINGGIAETAVMVPRINEAGGVYKVMYLNNFGTLMPLGEAASFVQPLLY